MLCRWVAVRASSRPTRRGAAPGSSRTPLCRGPCTSPRCACRSPRTRSWLRGRRRNTRGSRPRGTSPRSASRCCDRSARSCRAGSRGPPSPPRTNRTPGPRQSRSRTGPGTPAPDIPGGPRDRGRGPCASPACQPSVRRSRIARRFRHRGGGIRRGARIRRGASIRREGSIRRGGRIRRGRCVERGRSVALRGRVEPRRCITPRAGVRFGRIAARCIERGGRVGAGCLAAARGEGERGEDQ